MAPASRGKLSAEAVALARAAGARHRDPRLRNPDQAAKGLLRPLSRLAARVPLAVEWGYELFAPGIFWFLHARTREFDAQLAQALRDGARQVVILGAGLDTRAQRFSEQLEGRAVFEVDLPQTQAWKRARLAGPTTARFVSTDFLATPLAGSLAAAGFRPELRTFFLWEGVSMYLDAAAVDRTLATIAAAAPGSTVAFDLIDRRILEPGGVGPRIRRGLRWAELLGEPCRFGIAPEALEGFLRERGLELIRQLGPEALTEKYLVGSDGKRAGAVADWLSIAVARVPAPKG